MLTDVREVAFEFFVKDFNYLQQFRHLIHVNLAPVVAVQDEDEAPEDAFLVLNMHQQHRSDVVKALNVADLGVIVGVGKQDVEQLVFSRF